MVLLEHLAAFAIGILIYFIPSLVASHRRAKSRASILLLNVFIAATGIGWLILLVWALVDERT